MKVFISYSSVDGKQAKELADLLSELGIQYFFDQKDISWGDDINLEIREGIADCSAQIVILSPASLKSQWVPYEVGYASALGKQVLPYLTHPSLDVPGYLQRFHYKLNLEDIRSHLLSLLNSTEYKKSAEDYYLKGKALLEISEHIDALKVFNKALEIAPDHYLALFDKGRALMGTGSYPEAIKSFLDAEKINPKDDYLYSNIGYSLNELQRYSEAAVYLERALKINPNNLYALTNMSLSLGNLGKHVDARKLCERIVQINPMDDMAWNNIGASYGETGVYDKAIEYCRKAIGINPENENAKGNLSRYTMLLSQKKW